MDADDLFPKGVTDPLTTLGRQDLDPLSIEELNARIERLETIAQVLIVYSSDEGRSSLLPVA